MSEEPTERLGDDASFESRVLAELSSMNNRLTSLDVRLTSLDTRLTSLEDKVDARLRETRPIWEAVLSRLDVMDSKLDVLGRDLLETRAETELPRDVYRLLPEHC
ncbi:MAG TPA: hypothetical protein VF666_02365 [Pyrinomonadaceae bacterium]|jgi:flagellar capping protein FliD